MATFKEGDLFIVYRPEDGSLYKVTFEDLKEAILELVDGGDAADLD